MTPTATNKLTAAEIAAGSVTLGSAAFPVGYGFPAINPAATTISTPSLHAALPIYNAAPSNTSFVLDTTADAGTALSLSAVDAAGGVNAANVSVSLEIGRAHV